MTRFIMKQFYQHPNLHCIRASAAILNSTGVKDLGFSEWIFHTLGGSTRWQGVSPMVVVAVGGVAWIPRLDGAKVEGITRSRELHGGAIVIRDIMDKRSFKKEIKLTFKKKKEIKAKGRRGRRSNVNGWI